MQTESISVTPKQSSPWIRETIDSFGVALILAFLFRAFVAEAFVIPTGSMAPTLMGAHKDVTCSQCGCDYQSSASEEFNNETGGRSGLSVIGTTCPLCRYQQPIDIKANKNHATFSGDRILVSKLAYIQGDPQRWQVIVFKNPTEARQNYIKRLVGLPNETLRVQHGDVYAKPKGSQEFAIARKPHNIVEVLLQPLNDTQLRSVAMIQAGVPSPWQPQGPVTEAGSQAAPTSSQWKVTHTEQTWSAEMAKTAATISGDGMLESYDWLRYYHYTLRPWQWYEIAQTGKLSKPIEVRSAQLITDFTHYNAQTMTNSSSFRDGKSDLVERTPFGLGLKNFDTVLKPRSGSDGEHWVGDLAGEFDAKLDSTTGTVAIDLVEAGVHYVAEIDAASGDVKISAVQAGKLLTVFEDGKGGTQPVITGSSSLRGGSTATVKLANVDNTLHLWVNGDLVTLLPTANISSDRIQEMNLHRPVFNAQDAGDAAPVGIAFGNGMSGTVQAARVWRDIYYTAVNTNSSQLSDYTSFDIDLENSITEEVAEKYLASQPINASLQMIQRQYDESMLYRDILFSTPSLWANSPLFDNRSAVEFALDADQYFPMGDNSSKSLDARLWRPDHFVHRDLLIGRAALVFWPHHWNAPIPYLPNFKRFGIIR